MRGSLGAEVTVYEEDDDKDDEDRDDYNGNDYHCIAFAARVLALIPLA